MRRQVLDAPVVWDRLNAAAIARHNQSRPAALPDASQDILDSLNRDGVVTFSSSDLLEEGSLNQVGKMLDGVHITRAEEIEQVRKRAQHDSGFFDPFRISLFQGDWQRRGEAAIIDLALQPALKAIVDAYFGLDTIVARPRAWRAFGTDLPARRSQMFHRDYPLDRYMVKVFTYFTDVGEDAGPLTFLPGTHPKGRVHIHPRVVHEDQIARSDDDAIKRVFPPDGWRLCMGPAGTMTLADFRAWHRGSHGTRDRVHTQALYVSPSARQFVAKRGLTGGHACDVASDRVGRRHGEQDSSVARG